MSVSTKRLIRIIVLDVLVFGVLLLLVSLRACEPVARMIGLSPEDTGGTVLATPAPTEAPTAPPTEAPTPDPGTSDPDATPTPSPEPTPTPDPVAGLCGSRYPGKFTEGDIVSTDTEYRSKNIDITVTSYDTNGVRYQIADVYVQDIQCLQAYGMWMEDVKNARTPVLAKDAGAVLAINGDYYSNAKHNGHGWFVRNGQELARFDFSTYANDLCILYYDGTMEVIPILEITALDYDAILAKYPYQIWYFGPSLLTADGQARPEGTYNSTLMMNNPRSAIGYYEPGHYCLLTVEGRNKNDSPGMTMVEMSQLFAQLGCTAAYNLDGGGSAAMYFNGAAFGNDDRSTSDIVMIIEPVEEDIS